MNSYSHLAMVLFCILYVELCTSYTEVDCEQDSARTLGIKVVGSRNKTGQWVTKFSAFKDDTNINDANDISVDLSHTVTTCNGKRTLIIQGLIADKELSKSIHDDEVKPKKILFHHKCGTNVAVINNGQTLQKINLDEPLNSVAYTSRPLLDNELFEVTLDKKHNKFGNSLAIGVTSIPPTEISIPKHINHFPPPSWANYHSHLYHNGSEVMKNYGINLNTLVVGNRAGVMRSSTGTLHYYINGVDQGPAASNIPNPVYGLLELWQDAAMATIVNSS